MARYPDDPDFFDPHPHPSAFHGPTRRGVGESFHFFSGVPVQDRHPLPLLASGGLLLFLTPIRKVQLHPNRDLNAWGAEAITRFGGYRGIFTVAGGKRVRKTFVRLERRVHNCGRHLAQNNQIVIYEMPVKWMSSDPSENPLVELGTFKHRSKRVVIIDK